EATEDRFGQAVTGGRDVPSALGATDGVPDILIGAPVNDTASVNRRQARYRRELVQTMGILAGVHEQLGEYEEGIRVSREALAGTVELQDRRSEALVRQRLPPNLKFSGAR